MCSIPPSIVAPTKVIKEKRQPKKCQICLHPMGGPPLNHLLGVNRGDICPVICPVDPADWSDNAKAREAKIKLTYSAVGSTLFIS